MTCLDWDHPGSSVENRLVGGLKRSQHRLICLSVQQLFTVAKTTNKQESIPQVAANEWSGARGELCFLSATILGSTSYAYSSTKSCNYSNKQSGKMWHGVICALAGAQAGSTKVERKFLLGSWNKIVEILRSNDFDELSPKTASDIALATSLDPFCTDLNTIIL